MMTILSNADLQSAYVTTLNTGAENITISNVEPINSNNQIKYITAVNEKNITNMFKEKRNNML